MLFPSTFTRTAAYDDADDDEDNRDPISLIVSKCRNAPSGEAAAAQCDRGRGRRYLRCLGAQDPFAWRVKAGDFNACLQIILQIGRRRSSVIGDEVLQTAASWS